MRYLGLDLGTKTLGLAISDRTNIIATSLYTIRYQKYEELPPILEKIIEENQITCLVLGYPKNMNNTIGPRAEETERFKKYIEEKIDIQVELQDERLSTVSATRHMLEADLSRKKRKKHVDSLAASIILQTYLERRKGE